MATSEDAFRATLSDFARIANDLATWLRTAGVEVRDFKDSRAAKMGVNLEGCAKAAKLFAGGMINVVNAFDTYIGDQITVIEDEIDDIVSGGTAVGYKWGVDQVSFGGGTDEHNTCTVTADHAGANVEWVNADSIWLATVKMASSSGPTYHFFQTSMGAFDPTPTAYFEIVVYCPTAPVAGNYDVYWVAFPNPP